jgi:hypothetical protein
MEDEGGDQPVQWVHGICGGQSFFPLDTSPWPPAPVNLGLGPYLLGEPGSAGKEWGWQFWGLEAWSQPWGSKVSGNDDLHVW